MWGTGSGNLTELEKAINAQAALGYRLHTISTADSGGAEVAALPALAPARRDAGAGRSGVALVKESRLQ